ncbi:MAG: thioredoxin domain-containing protein [Candidatus Thiodiazotropha endolucinida]
MSQKKHNSPFIYDVTESTYEERVLKASHQQPVLVDFWAEWCAPCISLAPALERVIEELEGLVMLAKVEVDDNMRLAGHYRLRGFPTVILFVEGNEIGRFHGSRASHWLREWIEEHLGDYLAAAHQD